MTNQWYDIRNNIEKYLEASGNDTAAPPFVDENGIARSASFDEFMIEQIRLSQVDMDDKGK